MCEAGLPPAAHEVYFSSIVEGAGWEGANAIDRALGANGVTAEMLDSLFHEEIRMRALRHMEANLTRKK